jgi:glycerol kinase
MRFILALDQGTSSSRSIVFDEAGHIVAMAQREFTQIFPQPGWVEHNPEEIWATQLATAQEAIARAGISARDIAAIGITNQRETTVVWNRRTGLPIHNAIVWQDRRGEPLCAQLREQGHAAQIQQSTGLVVDSYFSATKIRWMLDHVSGAHIAAAHGDLAFGTIDSWLLYKLPDSLLPTVHPSSHVFGTTDAALLGAAIPVAGLAGDQQSALFGQACFKPGLAKNTYGTGCFMLMHTGDQYRASSNGLLTTSAAQTDAQPQFALEGSVFIGGAVVQWLRDGLRAIHSSSEVQALAESVPDAGGVMFVPAFTGLGAPYWDANARGAIVGLTRGSTVAHIARAALESIAYQSAALLQAMNRDSPSPVTELRVDGGACVNNLLMQFQADLLGIPVVRPQVTETTALGAAYLAGLATGVWPNLDALAGQWRAERTFHPTLPRDQAQALMAQWAHAVKQTTA